MIESYAQQTWLRGGFDDIGGSTLNTACVRQPGAVVTRFTTVPRTQETTVAVWITLVTLRRRPS